MIHHRLMQYVNLGACSSSIQSKEPFNNFGTTKTGKQYGKLQSKRQSTLTKVSVCSCISYAPKRLSCLSLLRLLKQQKVAALRSQKRRAKFLARPVASHRFIGLFLMLTLPSLIGSCSVRPRNVISDVESSTHSQDAFEFTPKSDGEKCTTKWDGYCLNGGTCYVATNAFDLYYPICSCKKPFGGKRCEQITHPEMYEVRISELQVAAMSTIVVMLVAIAIICSSGLYFYRRHLKSKEEAQGGFIKKCTKNWVSKHRNVQCTELQPLTVTTLQRPYLPDDTRTTVLID